MRTTLFSDAARCCAQDPRRLHGDRQDAPDGRPSQGSIGYRYDWKEEEARKNVLRTHTTAISSQMLYRLGQVSGDDARDSAPRFSTH